MITALYQDSNNKENQSFFKKLLERNDFKYFELKAFLNNEVFNTDKDLLTKYFNASFPWLNNIDQYKTQKYSKSVLLQQNFEAK